MHALGLIVAALVSGQAPATHPNLKRAAALLDKLEYSAGLRLLKQTLSEEALSVPQSVRAYSMLAVVHSARAEPELARKAYFLALRLDPAFRLGADASPKISRAFERALVRHEKLRPSALKVQVKPKGSSFQLQGSFKDPANMVQKILLHQAQRSPRALEARSQDERQTFSVSVEPFEGQAALHIALHAASGVRLLQWGSSEAPMRFSLPPPELAQAPAPVSVPAIREAPRWYTRWWVWTLIGVGVAGASVTAAVLATRNDNLLGRLEVP